MGRSRKRQWLCGGTGTRKSTTLKQIIEARYVPKNERVIVYDPNYQETWFHLAKINARELAAMKTGVYRICDIEPMEFYQIIDKHWRASKQYGGAVIAEDATKYLKHQKNSVMEGLFTGLRHVNADFWGISHTVADTPEWVIRQLHEFIFYKTGDSWSKDLRDRFPEHCRDAAEKIFREVNDPARVDWYRKALTITKTGSKLFGR